MQTLKTNLQDLNPSINDETYSNEQGWSKKQTASTAKDQEAIPK